MVSSYLQSRCISPPRKQVTSWHRDPESWGNVTHNKNKRSRERARYQRRLDCSSTSELLRVMTLSWSCPGCWPGLLTCTVIKVKMRRITIFSPTLMWILPSRIHTLILPHLLSPCPSCLLSPALIFAAGPYPRSNLSLASWTYKLSPPLRGGSLHSQTWTKAHHTLGWGLDTWQKPQSHFQKRWIFGSNRLLLLYTLTSWRIYTQTYRWSKNKA